MKHTAQSPNTVGCQPHSRCKELAEVPVFQTLFVIKDLQGTWWEWMEWSQSYILVAQRHWNNWLPEEDLPTAKQNEAAYQYESRAGGILIYNFLQRDKPYFCQGGSADRTAPRVSVGILLLETKDCRESHPSNRTAHSSQSFLPTGIVLESGTPN